ncbi:MAG: integrase [Rhodospirillaceae bacterium]|nr:integrase [Rhodospirillaceae bacterium]
MARSIHKLSATGLATLPTGLHADGDKLYLQVDSKIDARSWIFRYPNRKPDLKSATRYMGLGPYPSVSLKEARRLAETCRAMVRAGLDPLDERERERREALAQTAKAHTFRECAEKYMESKGPEWQSLKHAKQWRATLETYAYPVLGSLDIQAVDVGLVLAVLEPIWNEKRETARRVRGRIELILDSARVRELREGENPARWKGHLDQLLSKRSRLSVRNHPALPYSEIGDFMTALEGQEGVAAMGLQFLILTACRTGEVIGARWSEIDMDGMTWTVPGERMKAGKPHRVPLWDRPIQILKKMNETRLSDYVFPGMRPKAPLSNMAFAALLKRMKYGHITTHGFRSTFRDWAAESTAYPNEVCEQALAHTIANRNEAAYRRGDLFDKRRRLMNDWATYCNAPTVLAGSSVSPIRAEAR